MHAHFRRGPLIPRHFALDQINHNRLTPDHRLLQRDDLRFIFLVREPLAAIASQHAVMARIDPEHSWDAAGHYITRLQGLARIARAVAEPERAFALTYEDLTARTAETLGALTAFLQLPSPLSADYRTYRFTGVKSDPNDRIREGAIHAPTQHTAPDLPDGLEDRARNASHETQAVLVQR